MAQQARRIADEAPEPTAETREIVERVAVTPAIVLTDKKVQDAFYARVKQECDAFVPDVSTEKGRVEVRKMASKVTKSKTAIDKARLELTAEMRDTIAKVNAEGKVITEKLAELADEVRRPLTEWEAAEEARREQADAIIAVIQRGAFVQHGETSDQVSERAMQISQIDLDEALFGARLEMVANLRSTTVTQLRAAAERLLQSERDAAELVRLRDEAEQRRIADEARETAEREAQAEAEREAREAAARAAQAAAEEARIEQERADAAERAREEERQATAKRQQEAEEARQAEIEAAKRRAAEEAEEARRLAQQEIDAANERARIAQQEAEDERRRVEQAEQARKDEEARVAAEQTAREADAAHRREVMDRAAAVLTDFTDINTVQARAIIAAIADGNVPAVSIAF